MGLLIIYRLTDQFLHVGDTVIHILFVQTLQIFLIFCFLKNIPDQVLNTVNLRFTAEGLNQCHKTIYLLSGSSDTHDIVRIPQSIIETDAPHLSIVIYLFNGGSTDTALRNVNDSLYRHIIPAVVYGLQISQNILDFSAGIEVHASYHVIRNSFGDHLLFQHTGLGICPVKNGAVSVFSAFLYFGTDICGNIICLIVSRIKLPVLNQTAFSLVSPESLIFSSLIITYDRIGRVQNILRRTVILLQFDDFGFRIHFFIIQDIPDIGSAELINGLIIVTYHAQIAVTVCQQPNQFKLGRIGILILIHHDIAESFLIILQYLGAGLEKLHCLTDQVIKVKRIIFL